MIAASETLQQAQDLAHHDGRYVFVNDGRVEFRFDSFAREVIEFSPSGVRRDVSVFSFRGPTGTRTPCGAYGCNGDWTGD